MAIESGEKREAELTREQVNEYHLMTIHGNTASHLAEHFHHRRRKLEDEFAQLLGFKDRVDAKRQAFGMQIYLTDRMVRAHNKHTTPTVNLGVYGLTPQHRNLLIVNNSNHALYIGDTKDARPRDGKTFKVEPGGSIQYPGSHRGVFMAADSKNPLRSTVLDADDIIQITLEDPA